MNFPRYKFAKESESQLLDFLKEVRDVPAAQKNCDFGKYQIWKKLLPPDSILTEKLEKVGNENVIVIDESSNDESEKGNPTHSIETIKDVELLEDDNKWSVNDIAFTVKENLETLYDLSQGAKEIINNCTREDQEELFKILGHNLNNEEIFYLGESLQILASHDLISIFCAVILLPQMQKEYCRRLLTLIENIYNSKYSSSLNKEILTYLLETSENDIKTLLQYLSNVPPTYQAMLLRDFIFGIEVLNINHMFIVEALINKQVEYEALNKLVEMLSNISDDHVNDKAFGKLLMTVIQCLGTNVLLLEQPLKHIIAGHKSIWKSRLEKTFKNHYEDTLMFSQSFRD